MPTVFTIGETVYDIIFQDDQPMAARPGGSMLNTAVSLGRCGAKVEMITELGDDQVGKLVLDFLEANGVSTSFINPVPGFKTPVSLAFLDEQGNANYSFYKKYPGQRLKIEWPVAKKGDIVLFGSFYSLDPVVHHKIISFLKKSKKSGALIVYDPNIRKNHLGEIRKLMPYVEENIAIADIVRGSEEDFRNLFGLDDQEAIFRKIMQAGCNCLIITRAEKGSELITENTRLSIPARQVNVVSTIGAGDSYNAGLIMKLIENKVTVDDFFGKNAGQLMDILSYAAIFAADTCSSLDNYISTDTAGKFHVK
jgi:fructokinase